MVTAAVSCFGIPGASRPWCWWDGLSQQQWDAIPGSSIGTTEEAFNAQLRQCLGVSSKQPLPLQRTGALKPLKP